MNLILTDHLGQNNAQLGRRHSAGKRYHHFTAIGQVLLVGFGSIYQGSGIKVLEMFLYEIGNLHFMFLKYGKTPAFNNRRKFKFSNYTAKIRLFVERWYGNVTSPPVETRHCLVSCLIMRLITILNQLFSMLNTNFNFSNCTMA